MTHTLFQFVEKNRIHHLHLLCFNNIFYSKKRKLSTFNQKKQGIVYIVSILCRQHGCRQKKRFFFSFAVANIRMGAKVLPKQGFFRCKLLKAKKVWNIRTFERYKANPLRNHNQQQAWLKIPS